MAYEGPRSHRPLIIGRRGAVASNHPSPRRRGSSRCRPAATPSTRRWRSPRRSPSSSRSCPGSEATASTTSTSGGPADSVVVQRDRPCPGAATAERYAAGIPAAGPLAFSVPGSVGAWGAMHARLRPTPVGLAPSRRRSTTPATGSARRAPTGASPASRSAPSAAIPAAPRCSSGAGLPPAVGAPIVQADLARSLEAAGRGRADDFYRGDLGAGPGRRVPGGAAAWSRPDDLAAFQPETQAPIEAPLPRLRGPRAPPNSMGWVLLQELGIVEALRSRGDGSPLRRPRPHAGRGEEARVRRPRAVERRPAVPRHAARRAPRRPRTWRAARRRSTRSGQERPAWPPPLPGDTTYFCVVDGDRQRGVGYPEPQQRVRLGRDRRRHGHPPEQPHDPLAPRARPSRTASSPASGCATR